MFFYAEAFLSCLWVGGAVIPLRTFSPPAFLDAVDRYQATEILAVPAMTVALIEEAERSTYPLDSLNESSPVPHPRRCGSGRSAERCSVRQRSPPVTA
jgi:acyl-CoA synthetase (AMP-forming)/AMP-acid ligase II